MNGHDTERASDSSPLDALLEGAEYEPNLLVVFHFAQRFPCDREQFELVAYNGLCGAVHVDEVDPIRVLHELASDLATKACLLGEFADHGGFRGLAGLNAASWESPHDATSLIQLLDHQDRFVADDRSTCAKPTHTVQSAEHLQSQGEVTCTCRFRGVVHPPSEWVVRERCVCVSRVGSVWESGWATKPIRVLGRVQPVPSRLGEVDYVQRSFERFMADEYGAALAFARATSRDWSEAEDLTQDAFVAALRNWSEVARYERPDAFVRRVIANQQVSRVRRRVREFAKAHLVASNESTETELGDGAFWDAVQQLPMRQRQVIALHYVEDRSVSDIAAVLEIAEGTVKAHLHAARHALARLLGDEIDDEEGV